MSERVKIGAAGKNPLIEKVNQMNYIDIQDYAIKRMEKLLFVEQPNQLEWYMEEQSGLESELRGANDEE